MSVWLLAALWVGLALVATLLAIRSRASTALSEIVVGTVAQFVIECFFTPRHLLPAAGEDALPTERVPVPERASA